MKSILKFSLLFLGTFAFAQNNLIDTSTWTVGNGSVDGFWRLGSDSENVREMGVDPHGNTSVLWKAVPDAGDNQDGGWNSPYMSADHTKTYRFTVWIKKTNSNDGSTYFGPYAYDADDNANSRLLDGTVNVNPYFFAGDLPQLDTWYLLVGFLRESGYSSLVSEGGIYDLNGIKVQSITDFKFSSTSTQMRHRAYLYYDTNTADRQFFWGPTIYEVNGQEPSIQELLDSGTSGSGSEGTQQTVWSTSGNDIHYNDGNVGIGTTSPTAKLEVNGSSMKLGGFHTQTTLRIEATDESGAPAKAVGIELHGYEGRSKGIYITDKDTDHQWFIGEGYNYQGIGIGYSTSDQMEYGTNTKFFIGTTGNVGIGTMDPDMYKLAVKGKIRAEEIKVETGWADYVFTEGYDLPTLEEVEKHIQEKGHLINIPSASEVEANGIELGNMDRLLLEKIEELTLYILQQERQQKRLEQRTYQLEKQIRDLNTKMKPRKAKVCSRNGQGGIPYLR
ncbi:hypothetical protein [Ulvibacterium sp.]|uniref:hypothetical protein n=1 Tax=Ulvibacterium sp. TaxID=2665914 RepID=UPI003BA94EA0